MRVELLDGAKPKWNKKTNKDTKAGYNHLYNIYVAIEIINKTINTIDSDQGVDVARFSIMAYYLQLIANNIEELQKNTIFITNPDFTALCDEFFHKEGDYWMLNTRLTVAHDTNFAKFYSHNKDSVVATFNADFTDRDVAQKIREFFIARNIHLADHNIELNGDVEINGQLDNVITAMPDSAYDDQPSKLYHNAIHGAIFAEIAHNKLSHVAKDSLEYSCLFAMLYIATANAFYDYRLNCTSEDDLTASQESILYFLRPFRNQTAHHKDPFTFITYGRDILSTYSTSETKIFITESRIQEILAVLTADTSITVIAEEEIEPEPLPEEVTVAPYLLDKKGKKALKKAKPSDDDDALLAEAIAEVRVTKAAVEKQKALIKDCAALLDKAKKLNVKLLKILQQTFNNHETLPDSLIPQVWEIIHDENFDPNVMIKCKLAPASTETEHYKIMKVNTKASIYKSDVSNILPAAILASVGNIDLFKEILNTANLFAMNKLPGDLINMCLLYGEEQALDLFELVLQNYPEEKVHELVNEVYHQYTTVKWPLKDDIHIKCPVLFQAIQKSTTLALKLIDLGADLNVMVAEGGEVYTPLTYAFLCKKKEIIAVIQERMQAEDFEAARQEFVQPIISTLPFFSDGAIELRHQSASEILSAVGEAPVDVTDEE